MNERAKLLELLIEHIRVEMRAILGGEWDESDNELAGYLDELRQGESSPAELEPLVLDLFRRFPAADLLARRFSSARSRIEVSGAEWDLELFLKARPDPLQEAGLLRYVSIPVYFATTRASTSHASPNSAFGATRGSLSYGVVNVSIPDSHVIGRDERPNLFKLQRVEDPAKHVSLLSIELFEPNAWSGELAKELRQTRKPSILVFVHGFRVNFADAARRTAQIAYDLNFDGVPIAFSWPSENAVFKYIVDETNARWTVAFFIEFLDRIAALSHGNQIQMIAHSMGNRVLTDGLEKWKGPQANGRTCLQQVMMAAPDVDAGTFELLVPDIVGQAERFTLYASSNDRALRLSKLVHGYARAGESGEHLVVLDDVDTIDASSTDTSLLGHSYYGDSRSVLTDIFEVVHHGSAPPERFGMRERQLVGRKYWIFSP